MQPRYRGPEGPKLPTHFAGGIRLHVPRVEMARPAIVEKQNAGPDRGRRGTGRRWAFGPVEIGQVKSQTPQAADLQQSSPLSKFPSRPVYAHRSSQDLLEILFDPRRGIGELGHAQIKVVEIWPPSSPSVLSIAVERDL